MKDLPFLTRKALPANPDTGRGITFVGTAPPDREDARYPWECEPPRYSWECECGKTCRPSSRTAALAQLEAHVSTCELYREETSNE